MILLYVFPFSCGGIRCRGNDVIPITCQGHRGDVCHIGGRAGIGRAFACERAELSLVVPCEVGGTAEWAFSRPSLHHILFHIFNHNPPP